MVGTPPLVLLENAGFSHGRLEIFQDVSLTVNQGETLCLLGPNGCGKTTLIDCILGIHRLNRGGIRVDGTPVEQLSPSSLARKIAYVPQQQAVHFSFSVLDMLLMGRTPHLPFYASPADSDRRMALDLLAATGLSHLADRDASRLSGGETRLVMILRALIQETPAIVMDEPTAHLDFRHELMVLETICRLIRERNLTLIMATHFPNHAFFLENEGIPVTVAFMTGQRVEPAGAPTRSLTEENLARFYKVQTAVMRVPGKGNLRQVIPIQTLADGENASPGRPPEPKLKENSRR